MTLPKWDNKGSGAPISSNRIPPSFPRCGEYCWNDSRTRCDDGHSARKRRRAPKGSIELRRGDIVYWQEARGPSRDPPEYWGAVYADGMATVPKVNPVNIESIEVI